VARQVLPPSGLGLLLFTFILLLDQISQLMRVLVSKGADLPTVVRAFVYLLPSIFSVTIPMAFLLGVLLAFGRMAADSEIVALRASGISPARLLRPVLALAVLAAGATFYVMAVALPAANQAYRELLFRLVLSRAQTALHARVFSGDVLPQGMVLYVGDLPAGGDEWRDVFIYDERDVHRPRLILARRGQLAVDRERRHVEIRLREGTLHSFDAGQPASYDASAFAARSIPLPFDEFYPERSLSKTDREMSLLELRSKLDEQQATLPATEGAPAREAARRAISGYRVEIHKKFAIPVACLVFGLLGLGLSLGTRKEARSAAFGLSIGVIFVYYVLIRLGEQAAENAGVPPGLAIWSANLLLGLLGAVLLVLNHREAAFDPLDASHYRAALLPLARRRPSRPGPARAATRAGRVLVIRVPGRRLPMPGRLDRYIASIWTGKFALVLLAFWSLFVLVNFMDLFDDVQQNRVKGAVVLRYYAFYSPAIVHLVAPVAVLVAVLVTFGVLARRKEITAMKAAGISLYRTVLPALALGVVASLGLFSLSELILPPMNRVAKEEFNEIKGRPRRSASLLGHRWVQGTDGTFYNFQNVGETAEGFVLYGLGAYSLQPGQWRLREYLHATRAVWRGVSWELDRGFRRTVLPQPAFRDFTQVRTREVEPPAYFQQEERDPETLSFVELRAHISSLEALGLDVTALRVQLHRKLAFPAVAVIMTLIGIPFAFVVARRGALYGVGVSILVAIVYWACLAIFDALGTSAALPAMLAAWAPNLLFGAAGFYLMLGLDT
jgi:LPS export ABC transporter permease LptG/LPS export ABC transporter permease LptF